MTRDEITRAIDAELSRALDKHGDASMSGAAMSPAQRYVVIGEECGEVARALLDGDAVGLEEELTQVAACAIAWLGRLP